MMNIPLKPFQVPIIKKYSRKPVVKKLVRGRKAVKSQVRCKECAFYYRDEVIGGKYVCGRDNHKIIDADKEGCNKGVVPYA